MKKVNRREFIELAQKCVNRHSEKKYYVLEEVKKANSIDFIGIDKEVIGISHQASGKIKIIIKIKPSTGEMKFTLRPGIQVRVDDFSRPFERFIKVGASLIVDMKLGSFDINDPVLVRSCKQIIEDIDKNLSHIEREFKLSKPLRKMTGFHYAAKYQILDRVTHYLRSNNSLYSNGDIQLNTEHLKKMFKEKNVVLTNEYGFFEALRKNIF